MSRSTVELAEPTPIQRRRNLATAVEIIHREARVARFNLRSLRRDVIFRKEEIETLFVLNTEEH